MKASHLLILRSVLERPTAPFREERVVDLVHQIAARLDHVRFRRDALGNVLLRYRRGRIRRTPLAIQAHLDHPGFHAVSQTRTGRVTARFLGGMRRECFVGSRVVFHGLERVRARVLRVRRPRGEPDLVATLEADGRVEPGTIGTWDVPTFRVRGEKLETRAADDLTGVAAILCLFEDLARRDVETDVVGVLTRAEEVGFTGALGLLAGRGLARRTRVITLECSKELPGARLGDGPIVRVGDRISIYSPTLTDTVTSVARNLAKADPTFRYQRKLMDGGACEATAFAAYGHEASGICLALDNVHNMTARGTVGPERVHLGDLAGMIRLLEAIVTADLSPRGRARELRTRLEKRYRARARGLEERWGPSSP